MNKYNFENNKKKSQKSIIAFIIILIIAVLAYINSDDTFAQIKNIEKNIIITVDELKGVVKEEEIKQDIVQDQTTSEVIQALSIPKKKQDFLNILLEPVNKVYKEFDTLYKEIKENSSDKRVKSLKKEYKVATYDELLVALKPHPKSIALAQAAMESAWATSRFFNEANNIFGVWSFNKNEPRIAASELRGKETIWLKKYASVEDSVRDYYKTLSRAKAFKAFRILNAKKEHQNPYLLTVKLDKYSEKGALYGEELNAMISFNKFVRFDEVQYSKETVKEVENKEQVSDSLELKSKKEAK